MKSENETYVWCKNREAVHAILSQGWKNYGPSAVSGKRNREDIPQ